MKLYVCIICGINVGCTLTGGYCSNCTKCILNDKLFEIEYCDCGKHINDTEIKETIYEYTEKAQRSFQGAEAQEN